MAEERQPYIEERAPCHISLLTPMQMGGVPRDLAILNGTIAAAFAIGAGNYWILPVFIASHMLFRKLAKVDPYFFDVFREYVNDKPYYDV